MGSSPIYFPLVPDWSQLPSLSFGISRDLVSFAGTAAVLSSITDLTPLSFELSFMTNTKEDEYNLLTFLHQVMGKSKRFWIEYPIKQFELTGTALSGSSSIEVEPNGFNKISQGNERCFWAMNNGDLIVRKIDEANYDSDTDVLTLVIDTDLDRDIAPTDYFIFGRFLLCRLDEDTIKQEIESDLVSNWSMKFTELPAEYDAEEIS